MVDLSNDQVRLGSPSTTFTLRTARKQQRRKALALSGLIAMGLTALASPALHDDALAGAASNARSLPSASQQKGPIYKAS
jgi:hypothetical protein